MTCARARALLETSSFMGRPRSEVEAARRHAESCEACRAALAADAALLEDLQSLASPVDAPDVTAVVLARIEQTETAAPAHPRRREADASWGLLVASALIIGVALVIWGPQAVDDVTAQLPEAVRPDAAARGVLQPAIALINIALYVAVLLMPLLTRGVKSRKAVS